MKDSIFAEIPYKTLLKILNRLEEEKLISSISKGVYSIGKIKSNSDPDIVQQYTTDGKGMIVGYVLYQGLGVSSYHPLVTEIYTNFMTSAHKNIGRFHLTRVDLEFTDVIINLIALLELIRDGYDIKGCDFIKLNKTIDVLLNCYTDTKFAEIISAIHYPYSVVTTLNKKLKEKYIPNDCLAIYKEVDKQK